MKYYSIAETSRLLNVTAQTLRNWDKSGKLKPHHTTDSGYRYYSQEQLNRILGVLNVESEIKTDEIFLNTILSICKIHNNIVSRDCQNKLEMIKELIEYDTSEES